MPKRRRAQAGAPSSAKKARKQTGPRQSLADSTPSASVRKRARSQHVESPAVTETTIASSDYGSPSAPAAPAPNTVSAHPIAAPDSLPPTPSHNPSQHATTPDRNPTPRKRARLSAPAATTAAQTQHTVRRRRPYTQTWDRLPLDVVDIVTSHLSLRDMMSLCQFLWKYRVSVPEARLWATAERRVRAFAAALTPSEAVAIEKKMLFLGESLGYQVAADTRSEGGAATRGKTPFAGMGQMILGKTVVSMLRNKKRIDVTRLDYNVLSTIERDLPAISKLTVVPRPAGATLHALQVSPALALIPRLRVLNLAGCGLQRLPGAVSALGGLQELDLSRNRLGWLPEGIGEQLRQLRFCSIVGCPLGEPPASLLATVQRNFDELVGRGQRSGVIVDRREEGPVTDEYLKRTITTHCSPGTDRGERRGSLIPFVFDRRGNPRPVWQLVFDADDVIDVDFIEMGLPPEVNIM